MGLLSAALVMAASTQATAQEYTFTTLVGLPVSSGSDDGPASLARFYYPEGVAVDTRPPMLAPCHPPGGCAQPQTRINPLTHPSGYA